MRASIFIDPSCLYLLFSFLIFFGGSLFFMTVSFAILQCSLRRNRVNWCKGTLAQVIYQAVYDEQGRNRFALSYWWLPLLLFSSLLGGPWKDVGTSLWNLEGFLAAKATKMPPRAPKTPPEGLPDTPRGLPEAQRRPRGRKLFENLPFLLFWELSLQSRCHFAMLHLRDRRNARSD